ncbi:MAG TPA: ABC transporter ATP-binding protein [Candidatus Pelethenecus faecipullorum]|uniref:ABC transporter ATP-binding protein n=1 Tax=Candidatus Pelethenecus faecipullorum TaxID=2840900 RepID=A0A9D1KIE5_9MOLU|nr:ABC transporter ATP-binding protein [Candidatus Pelethenecus faecipullorum]
MLEIKNVSKTYRNAQVKAIDSINLTIEDGDIYGFIGPNGAGKSTMIKCITGIHPFEEGDILLDGVSILKDPLACKKKIAYVPDNPDIYEQLSGIDYIRFICDVYGVKEERNERISRYAKMFGIEERLNDPIKGYSHGMKQKIVLIASLVHEPKLLILDEPFVGLDPKASYDLKEIMRELCQQGTMVFFSSHVLEVVEKLCNKIAIIKEGKIISAGLTEEVKGDSSLENVFLELFDE